MNQEKVNEYRQSLSDMEQVDQLIKRLKVVKSNLKKKEAMIKKRETMTTENSTQKRLQQSSADLTWHGMYLDQSLTDVARFFKGSFLDVGTEEKEYNPSPFHKYRY